MTCDPYIKHYFPYNQFQSLFCSYLYCNYFCRVAPLWVSACHVTGAEGAEAWNLSGVVQTNSEPNPNNSKPYLVWKMGQIQSAPDSQKNSKPYPVWKIGQIPSAPHSQTIPKSYPVWRIGPDSKCATLTNNSKPNPVWRHGEIPSRPHWQTIPVWETGWDSKYTTLTINAIYMTKYGHRNWKYKHGYHIFEKALIVCLEMWNSCEGGL